jgi:hypothetical protein
MPKGSATLPPFGLYSSSSWSSAYTTVVVVCAKMCHFALSVLGMLMTVYLAAAVQPFSGQDIEEVFQSMSSDDCLRVWDALVKHVPLDFDVESQVGMPTRFIQDVCAT